MTSTALTTGTRLGHFTVIGPLGAGGMGEVYRARDERLRRDVALKVLPADTMDDPSARARLLGEARRAAGLNHPHICTIHDVGEEQGRVFIAMELVEGRPLSEVAGVAGFTSGALIRIGGEIAQALSHAHEHDVIHRDLKSANVLVTSDGTVKVLDFGLAKRVSNADAPAVTRSIEFETEPGVIVGTTHYLPPEVLAGAEADARGDLWALGVILHEMAAKAMPFDGQTAFEVAAAIMHSPPRPLPEHVPSGLRSIIARCLEKEPARRYQRAGEVRAALEAAGSAGDDAPPPRTARARRAHSVRRERRFQPWQVAVGSLAVVIAAAVVLIRVIPGDGGARASGLAVLPLENLSHDPEQAYFADGMTEEISTRLAQISALRVIAQTSVSDLVQKRKSLSDIGRALRVPILLRGSVLRVADRVRINVQLIKAATGELIWVQEYERKLLDVLSLQSEVALAIAKQIHVVLTPREQAQ